MFFIADLHLHSHYSRATSRDLTLENLWRWARIKGIHIVGTGDFTHPLWFKELKEKLEPDGTGFFRLKNPPKEDVPGFKVQDIDVRFCLSSEISSIYKFGEKVRKNHNCVFAPDFETVVRLNAKLSRIGNLESDGRPILGLSARDLLEIILETSEYVHLIPAHIWTPWFSMLGSKSGYDSVKECFRDLAEHIFALETGLSSDPEMNWRLSMLDKYSLVSNSDAHSPQKLGREANLFDTERSYFSMFDALKTKKGFLGTYEFFPEEGKYHLDGHRNCDVCFEPEETIRHKGICPKCGQPLTVGVLHRVTLLADRKNPKRPESAANFHYIIPLPEILAELKNSSPASKQVMQAFQQVISSFGNEFTFLNAVPVEDIEKKFGAITAEAIRRMRTQQVNPHGGYDGQFGVIKIFKEGEIESLSGQQDFFGKAPLFLSPKGREKKAHPQSPSLTLPIREGASNAIPPLMEGRRGRQEDLEGTILLNPEQHEAEHSTQGAVLVIAGPGTGKTKTLIHWMVNCIASPPSPLPRERGARGEALAVTFTNKAADEMRVRLENLLGDKSKGITIGTFHSVCFGILKERYKNLQTVYDDESRKIILRFLFPGKDKQEIESISEEMKKCFESPEEKKELSDIIFSYRNYCRQHDGIDLTDIINQVLQLWKNEPERLEAARNKFRYIAVDELQDINPVQYEFLKLLYKTPPSEAEVGGGLFAIGDPDQSIYGFRGSDIKLFFRFKKDFNAREIYLKQNYRSTNVIVEVSSNLIRNNESPLHLLLKGREKSLDAASKVLPFGEDLGGAKVKLLAAKDEYEEARFIIDKIEKLIGGTQNLSSGYSSSWQTGKYGFADIAVLFRTRAIGKYLLHHFRQSGIPVRFGDASAWLASPPFSVVGDVLRLYLNPKDMVAMEGVLTYGFGMNENEKKKIISSQMKGEKNSVCFWEAWTEITVEEAVKIIFERFLATDLTADRQVSSEEIQVKKEIILELARESQSDIERFLHKLTLDSYTDTGRMKSDAVQLLTFHASKGLEFPVVFIAGAEEGITPILRNDSSMEEERRLFYVAMTRAKDMLLITHVKNRTKFGKEYQQKVSRFVNEISPHLIEIIKGKEEVEQLKLF